MSDGKPVRHDGELVAVGQLDEVAHDWGRYLAVVRFDDAVPLRELGETALGDRVRITAGGAIDGEWHSATVDPDAQARALMGRPDARTEALEAVANAARKWRELWANEGDDCFTRDEGFPEVEEELVNALDALDEIEGKE